MGLFSNQQPRMVFVPKLVIVNFPQTTTILALGFFVAVVAWPYFLAVYAERVPEAYQDEMISNGKFARDAMLIILGYYFAKVVDAVQERLSNKAIEAAAATPVPSAPQSAKAAAEQVADAADKEAGRITGE